MKEIVKGGLTGKRLARADKRIEVRKKSKHHMNRHHLVFWCSLVVISIANVLVAGALIPVMVALDTFFLDVLVFILGIITGSFYSFLLVDVSHIKRRHRILSYVLLPAIAIINIFVMGNIAIKVAIGLKITSNQQNPWFLAILYTVAFLLPYAIDQLRISYGRQSFHKA